MTAADDAKTGASGGEPPRLSNNPNTENADDDLLLANAAAAHLLGATMRPDLVAKARALVEDEDDGDDAMGGGEDGDGDEMMFPLPAAKKVPGGITPMGVRADRGAGPLGGEGAATLAEMNGALSDLNTWHDRRRREEQRMREKLEAGGAAGTGTSAGDAEGDEGFAAVGQITANVDAELAALDDELEEAMRVMRSGGIVDSAHAEGTGATTGEGATTGAEAGVGMTAGMTAGMTMGVTTLGGTRAGVNSRGPVRRARPMSASARRGGRPLDVGPAIGTGVFGAQEGMHQSTAGLRPFGRGMGAGTGTGTSMGMGGMGATASGARADPCDGMVGLASSFIPPSFGC